MSDLVQKIADAVIEVVRPNTATEANEIYTTIRQALGSTQERGEAVAEVKVYEDVDGDTQYAIHWLGKRLPHGTKLYAHPPADAQRVAELEEEEITALVEKIAARHDLKTTGLVGTRAASAIREAILWKQTPAKKQVAVLQRMLTSNLEQEYDMDRRIAALEAQLAFQKKRADFYLQQVDELSQTDPRIAALEAQLTGSREREGRMREALRLSRYCLQQANEAENGPIRDTIWFSKWETLFDYMDSALAAEKEQK